MSLRFSGRAEAWVFMLHIPIAAFDSIAEGRASAAALHERMGRSGCYAAEQRAELDCLCGHRDIIGAEKALGERRAIDGSREFGFRVVLRQTTLNRFH